MVDVATPDQQKKTGGGRGPFLRLMLSWHRFPLCCHNRVLVVIFCDSFKKNWDGFFWKIGCDKLRRLQKDIFGDLNARSHNEQRSQRKSLKTNSFLKKKSLTPTDFFSPPFAAGLLICKYGPLCKVSPFFAQANRPNGLLALFKSPKTDTPHFPTKNEKKTNFVFLKIFFSD